MKVNLNSGDQCSQISDCIKKVRLYCVAISVVIILLINLNENKF